MRLWPIPMIYVGATVVCGFVLPRVEEAYLADYSLGVSVASAQAYLSAVASGMMALTAIVFAMAFVMVQFSAIAYSPRLVLWFARDHVLFHSLGAFTATFLFALFSIAWVDRRGSGTVPLFSNLLLVVMLITSMLLFARLMQRLTDLQITSVLCLIGDKGRQVIREMFRPLDKELAQREVRERELLPIILNSAEAIQTVKYRGEPRTIARLEVAGLVQQAQVGKGVIVMTCAVGDTVVDGTPLLQIHGAKGLVSEPELMRTVHLEKQRTFDQDPKYALRLLVDIAIKALSPAINDPTTAVQTIDQIEDLLCRLGGCELDIGYATDANGELRLIFPMPTWEDYLTLACDEIRHYGASSVQVMRRLRSVLLGLLDSLQNAERADAVRRYLRRNCKRGTTAEGRPRRPLPKPTKCAGSNFEPDGASPPRHWSTARWSAPRAKSAAPVKSLGLISTNVEPTRLSTIVRGSDPGS